MKKLLSLLSVNLLLLWLFNYEVFAEGDDSSTYFIVTAYYSPLPNQDFYLKWNYKDELRLNGMWISWASWKGVFPWMLAAPKNYKFWTKIQLEWVWIWSVEDRGWAIVNAWNRWYSYDRIDIWMWYWDEWLRRALNWWKRKVKWTILSNNTKVNLDINKVTSSFLATRFLKKLTNNTFNKKKKIVKSKELSILDKYIYNNSNKNDIKLLQEKLIELKLYSGELTWYYNDIENIIIEYQISKNIIISKNSYWAWYFWPKTRKDIKIDYEKYLEITKAEEERKNYLTKKYNELSQISESVANNTIDYIWRPLLWDISPEVRELQLTLKQLWYFTYNDTAIFWSITKESIIDFQIKNKIITLETDHWSWILWPKTREALKNILKKQTLLELMTKHNLDTDELANVLKLKI